MPAPAKKDRKSVLTVYNICYILGVPNGILSQRNRGAIPKRRGVVWMKKRLFLLLALTAALLLTVGMSTAMATEEECPHFFSYCDTPDICANCGGPYRGQTIVHHWSPFQSDENYHWWVCEVCAEKSPLMSHMAYCDAPGVCADCGYQGDIWVEHERNWEYHYNETEHWMICPRCQEELDRCSHRSRCTESVCSSCGAPLSGITAEVDHQIDETGRNASLA